MDLEVIYANYPDEIIFSIRDAQYVLIYDPSGRLYPYHLFPVGRSRIHVVNLNEWVARQTRGHCSLDTLLALAKAYSAARQSCLPTADLYSKVWESLKHELFDKGAIIPYLRLYDIECMDNEQLQKLASEVRSGKKITKDQLQRLETVCAKRGLHYLSEFWSRLVGTAEEREVVSCYCPDEEICRIMGSILEDASRLRHYEELLDEYRLAVQGIR